MRRRYGEGESLTRLADEYGLSLSTVDKRRKGEGNWPKKGSLAPPAPARAYKRNQDAPSKEELPLSKEAQDIDGEGPTAGKAGGNSDSLLGDSQNGEMGQKKGGRLVKCARGEDVSLRGEVSLETAEATTRRQLALARSLGDRIRAVIDSPEGWDTKAADLASKLSAALERLQKIERTAQGADRGREGPQVIVIVPQKASPEAWHEAAARVVSQDGSGSR